HRPQEVPHINTFDISQRVPLHKTCNTTIYPFKHRINLNDWDLRSCPRRLIFPLSCNPSFETLESTTQRSYFPHTATLLVTILVAREQTLVPHKSLNRDCIREHVLDSNPVLLLHSVEESVGFRV